MDRSNLEKYYYAIANLKQMQNHSVISLADYIKAESFLAEKYCIKNGSLYRSNDLIINDFRAIYIKTEKEV